FWDERFERTEIVKNYMIRPLKYDTQQTLREKIQAITFTGQYGDKLYPKYCNVDSKFEGEVQYLGNKYLVLSGNFGDFLTPTVSWRNNLVCDREKGTQIWPEFKTEGNVKVEYT